MNNSNPIKYLLPDLPRAREIAPFLERIDAQRRYSNGGPLLQEFEAAAVKLMQDLGGGETPIAVVALATGHAALEIALRYALPKPGRVLTPSLTFASTIHAILNTGGAPIFADVDARTLCLTPALAREALDQGEVIDAVMPVCAFGAPQDCGAWDAFAVDTGLPVILDAAAAFGAQAIPDRAIVCHSLHATKPFGIGEGGAMATRNQALAAFARAAQNFGFRGERKACGWGANAKLSEYHAAVALAQHARWPEQKRARRDLWARYGPRIAALGCAMQHCEDAFVPSTLVTLLPEGADAADVAHALMNAGVETARPYLPPAHEHPYFAELGLAAARGHGELAVTRAIAPRLIALPFHPFLTEEDIARIVDAVRTSLG